jgi:hypothetical protein
MTQLKKTIKSKGKEREAGESLDVRPFLEEGKWCTTPSRRLPRGWSRGR